MITITCLCGFKVEASEEQYNFVINNGGRYTCHR